MFPSQYTYLDGDRKILFTCTLCGKTHRNKRAIDDEITRLPELIKAYAPFLESSFDTGRP
jgi:flavorubredoxin